MSAFALMREAWEAALEGEIERSFRLADEAGVPRFELALLRNGHVCAEAGPFEWQRGDRR